MLSTCHRTGRQSHRLLLPALPGYLVTWQCQSRYLHSSIARVVFSFLVKSVVDCGRMIFKPAKARAWLERCSASCSTVRRRQSPYMYNATVSVGHGASYIASGMSLSAAFIDHAACYLAKAQYTAPIYLSPCILTSRELFLASHRHNTGTEGVTQGPWSVYT